MRGYLILVVFLLSLVGGNSSLCGKDFADKFAELQSYIGQNDLETAKGLIYELGPELDAEGILATNIYFHALLVKTMAYLDLEAKVIPRIEALEEAIVLVDSLPTQTQADIHCSLAKAYFWIGGSSSAAEGHAQYAVDLLERTDELNSELGLTAFRVLANAMDSRRDFESLVSIYLKMIQIDQAIAPMGVRRGQLHFWLGGYYQNLGRYLEAAAEFAKADRVFRSVDAPSVHFAYLENALGNLEESQGNLEASLIYYYRALDMFSDAGQTSYNFANVHMNIANVLRQLNRTDSALVYGHKAVDLYNANPSPMYSASRAHMYHDLSRIYSVRKAYPEALELIQEGLHILDPDYAVEDIATIPRHLEREDSYVQIYLLNAKASYLHNLAWSDESRSDWLDLAMKHLQANLDLIDSVREAHYFPGNIDAFRQVSTNCYESAVAMALKAHKETGSAEFLAKAFDWVEADRAYQLQSDLFRIRARPYTFYPDSLLRLEEETQAMLTGLQQRLALVNDDPRLEQVLSERIYALSSRIGDIHRQIETDYPDFIRFQKRQESLSLDDLQAAYPEAVLVRYHHNQLDSVISAFYLGPGHAPSLLYLDKKLTSALLAQMDAYLALLENRVHATQRSNDTVLIREHQALGHAMFQTLLAPILDSLRPSPETPLLIIPDSKLGYLPFEALFTEELEKPQSWRELAYLIRKHPVVYAYATTTALPGTQSGRVKNPRMLGVAPSYSHGNWAPLVYNTRELDLIQGLFPGKKLTGEAALEASFREMAGAYDILHIATHAFTDDENPYYSGLVFADKSDGNYVEEDGILHAYEISGMNLQADLATLSGCATGTGALKKGEGIMSLARAFRSAGCANVLMSHWPAEDLATARLMVLFYQNLHDGASKAQALRKAKLDYLRQYDDLHPFFWNNFVLIGGESGLASESVFSNRSRNTALVVLLLLVLGAWIARKRRKEQI